MKKLPVHAFASRFRIATAASATISGVRPCRASASPPRTLSAAVAMTVRGQSAFTAMPRSRSSSAIPSTHIDMPYFAIV